MQSRLPQFSSFFWAGYECTYALNEVPVRIDMLAETKHDVYCQKDYRLIKELGITTVREGLSWSQIGKGNGVYDFSRFEPMMKLGKDEGIQQIWDLNHFDFPTGMDVLSDGFVQGFAAYAKEAIKRIAQFQTGQIYITPINEISFFAWIGADLGTWAPYLLGRENGLLFKQQLVRASIAAMDAIWSVDSTIRFIHPDPFMRRVAVEPAHQTAREHVAEFNDVIRFQAWDMLYGKAYPELGGDPKYLDIIGINYYFHNQEFVFSQGEDELVHQAMEWESPSRIPLGDMLATIAARYEKPLVISETGSFDELRSHWWERTLAQIDVARKQGIPIYGVCAYPTVDRPDTVDYLLRRSGLWDFADEDLECIRIPHNNSLQVIQKYVHRWEIVK